MLLVFSLVFGFAAVPAAATEAEETQPSVVEETVPVAETVAAEESAEAPVIVEESMTPVTLNTDKIELSFDTATLWADESIEIDEEDPAIITVEEELQEMKVLNADGQPAPMTAEQIQNVLYMYQQYLNHWKANADVLGVQTPFFLSYNDNGADGLGILGEMLVLAGVSVDVVRAGYMSYDDLTGMIQNFLYGDTLGVALYGNAIRAARDEVMALVAASGAKTDVQKYLVINDWIAHNTNFDMPYIMGGDAMVAETPVKHEYYDTVYKVIYGDYEKQLASTFQQQILTGLEAEFKMQYYMGAIESIVYEGAVGQGAPAEVAKEQAQQYLLANSEAIAANPAGFVDSSEMFKIQIPVTDAEGNPVLDEAGNPVTMPLSAQLHAGWDAFWADAKTNGLVIDPVNMPDQKFTVDQIVAMQLDTPMADLGGMTPNQAIPVFADQAAAGLTDGVLNYWQGSHFGALGRGVAVCLGYSKAFSYLTQFMHPEIYGVNGAESDLTKAENWKDASQLYYDANGNLDINQNYVVDTVRISFNASVTMYGIVQDNFNSDHFWNAVKVDGKWYYIDPCYTDVYTEVMMRDRVETDGSMNHMYFMFSHKTAEMMYSGYYTEIKTLYAGVSNDTSYEDSWVSRIKSNVYSDGTYFYYLFDSTDLITMLDDFNNDELDIQDVLFQRFSIVRHKLTDVDAGSNGNYDFQSLVEFNFRPNKDSVPVARVFNPATGQMDVNPFLTDLYEQYDQAKDIYSSLSLNCALYGGKVYFNLSNKILTYDLKTGAIDVVKEYNVVHGKRDDTNPFGGMAFEVVDSAEKADFTVRNHPIAGMTIKEDGNLYVSIATNFSFISGKNPHNYVDNASFGYEYEESNYNSNYSTYGNNYDSALVEMFGYSTETNDNDEFMWAANFVEVLPMGHVAGSEHTYETVSVEATCGRNAFTEQRCTTCGISKPGTRVEALHTALEHHFVYFEEQFYTKDEDSGEWNTGFCFVCTECGFAITEPEKPDGGTLSDLLAEIFGIDLDQQMETYEKAKAIYDFALATYGHDYIPADAKWSEDSTSVTFSKLACSAHCHERANTLDCLLNDNTISINLSQAVTAQATFAGGEGNCETGAYLVYTVSGEAEGHAYTATNKVALKPGEHYLVDGICIICGAGNVTRIYGDNRYATAFDVADEMKAKLGINKFGTIVVACGTNFADALSGSYLANKKSAPILLVNNYTMESVADYISDNLAQGGVVYLLGGEAAISAEMDKTLEKRAVNVKRLAGSNRYETNLLILKEAGVTNEDILVCTGKEFADSLSASATNRPILLVNNTLMDNQKQFLASLQSNKIYVIGGTAAVSEDLMEEVSGYGTTQRISGVNRYETSVNIAKAFFADTDSLVVAYGHKFPDGLCGGALASTVKAPLILTRDKNVEYAAAYAEEKNVNQGYILGGDILVSDETVRTIFGMLETDSIYAK